MGRVCGGGVGVVCVAWCLGKSVLQQCVYFGFFFFLYMVCSFATKQKKQKQKHAHARTRTHRTHLKYYVDYDSHHAHITPYT